MSHSSQWNEIPIKRLFIDRKGGAWGEEPDINNSIVCIRAADFITEKIRHSTTELTRRKFDEREIKTRSLQTGDLIIEKSGGGEQQLVGRVVSFELDEIALCSNFLELLRPNQKITHPRYVAYLLYSLWLQRANFPFIKQTTGIQNLDIEEYFYQNVKVPPLPEQHAIADYLDLETTRLDSLIAAKEHLLELLAEKRRAVITHAVTQGLSADVSLRDSGVEWLGEIPSHWKKIKIKHISQVGNGSTPFREKPEYWLNGSFPWLTSTVVNNDVVQEPYEFVTEVALKECHLPIVQPNSILVAITGQGKTRGKAAILRYEATINQHIAFISPDFKLMTPEYLQLFLSSTYEILRMISDGTGSTKGALTCEELGEFAILLPPIKEQQGIVKYVYEQTSRIDELSQKAQLTIDLLHERREALIAEAVSGQLQVELNMN